MKHQLALGAILLATATTAFAADSKRILIVVGPSNHPPGSHEVTAGGRLVEYCLEHMRNVTDVKTQVLAGWPDEEQRAGADSIVFLGDTFPPNRLPDAARNLAELDGMMRRGVGIVCVHYATGLLGSDVESDGTHPLLQWLGGYFANRSCPHHQSIAKIFPAAVITPAAPSHPISRGWSEFTISDEPYTNIYFGPDENRLAPNVTALATSMLPPETPSRETVAWCVERLEGGRGFGIVMPHFYRNWRDQDLRRLIMNGIVWTANIEVPDDGVITPAPVLSQFEPASVEYVPRVRTPRNKAKKTPG